jgi:CRISPR-associated RAMP protein (TIGR02581 family)
MLKKMVNECSIEMVLHTVDPILIKSGLATLTGPNMAFVVTYRNGTREPYLPGSSLKGVIRSHAERIARTLKSPSACEPFWNEEIKKDKNRTDTVWCGELFKRREGPSGPRIDNPTAYKDSCPACKLFGSTHFVGRLSVSDAYKVPGSSAFMQPRDGVGIDRFTGGASKNAKFDLEVLTDASFKFQIRIRNFELWQLGWLAYVMQDFRDEVIQVGSGRSRGLGRVRGEIESVKIACIPSAPEGLRDAQGRARLRGVGSLSPDTAYGFRGDDEVLLPQGREFVRPTGKLRHECVLAARNDMDMWLAVAPKWDAYIKNYIVPPEMARHWRNHIS